MSRMRAEEFESLFDFSAHVQDVYVRRTRLLNGVSHVNSRRYGGNPAATALSAAGSAE